MKKANRIYLSPPHLGTEEEHFVKDAFNSNYIAPLGPQVTAFEEEFSEYVGIKYAVALSSGTAAMHLALRYLGISEGDEVLASTLTFIGSVTPIIFEGATPVFIDANHETWNMSTCLLEKELEKCSKRGRLPKGVIPTDLYGQCCELPVIVEICNRYEVPVICDSAEAMGARYAKKVSDYSKVQIRIKYRIWNYGTLMIFATPELAQRPQSFRLMEIRLSPLLAEECWLRTKKSLSITHDFYHSRPKTLFVITSIRKLDTITE